MASAVKMRKLHPVFPLRAKATAGPILERGYRGFPDGATIVGDALRAEVASPVSDGEDRVLGRLLCFGLGFQLPQESRPLGPNAHTHGHFGYGGSLGMADPDVPYQVSLRIAEHVTCPDVQVRLIKDGDHRLSTERDLVILTSTIDELLGVT